MYNFFTSIYKMKRATLLCLLLTCFLVIVVLLITRDLYKKEHFLEVPLEGQDITQELINAINANDASNPRFVAESGVYKGNGKYEIKNNAGSTKIIDYNMPDDYAILKKAMLLKAYDDAHNEAYNEWTTFMSTAIDPLTGQAIITKEACDLANYEYQSNYRYIKDQVKDKPELIAQYGDALNNYFEWHPEVGPNGACMSYNAAYFDVCDMVAKNFGIDTKNYFTYIPPLFSGSTGVIDTIIKYPPGSGREYQTDWMTYDNTDGTVPQLSRTDAICPPGRALTRYQPVVNSDNTKFRVEYNCIPVPGIGTEPNKCYVKQTSWGDYLVNDNTNQINFDNYNAYRTPKIPQGLSYKLAPQCDANQALTEVKWRNHGDMSYFEYKCCDIPNPYPTATNPIGYNPNATKQKTELDANRDKMLNLYPTNYTTTDIPLNDCFKLAPKITRDVKLLSLGCNPSDPNVNGCAFGFGIDLTNATSDTTMGSYTACVNSKRDAINADYNTQLAKMNLVLKNNNTTPKTVDTTFGPMSEDEAWVYFTRFPNLRKKYLKKGSRLSASGNRWYDPVNLKEITHNIRCAPRGLLTGFRPFTDIAYPGWQNYGKPSYPTWAARRFWFEYDCTDAPYLAGNTGVPYDFYGFNMDRLPTCSVPEEYCNKQLAEYRVNPDTCAGECYVSKSAEICGYIFGDLLCRMMSMSQRQRMNKLISECVTSSSCSAFPGTNTYGTWVTQSNTSSGFMRPRNLWDPLFINQVTVNPKNKSTVYSRMSAAGPEVLLSNDDQFKTPMYFFGADYSAQSSTISYKPAYKFRWEEYLKYYTQNPNSLPTDAKQSMLPYYINLRAFGDWASNPSSCNPLDTYTRMLDNIMTVNFTLRVYNLRAVNNESWADRNYIFDVPYTITPRDGAPGTVSNFTRDPLTNTEVYPRTYTWRSNISQTTTTFPLWVWNSKNDSFAGVNIKAFLQQNKDRIETSLFNNPDYIRATKMIPFRQYEAITTPEAQAAAIGSLQYVTLPFTDASGAYSQARSTSITSTLEIGDTALNLKMVFKIQVLG